MNRSILILCFGLALVLAPWGSAHGGAVASRCADGAEAARISWEADAPGEILTAEQALALQSLDSEQLEHYGELSEISQIIIVATICIIAVMIIAAAV